MRVVSRRLFSIFRAVRNFKRGDASRIYSLSLSAIDEKEEMKLFRSCLDQCTRNTKDLTVLPLSLSSSAEWPDLQGRHSDSVLLFACSCLRSYYQVQVDGYCQDW